MRKVFLLGMALLFASAFVLAQDHKNSTEKIVKQTIDLLTDTKVGTEVLKAGEYRVMCNRETISFRNSEGKTVLTAKCKGPEMSAPSDRNEVTTSPYQGDVRVMTKLLLKGSNIEHVFD